jgi:hypothetical protein
LRQVVGEEQLQRLRFEDAGAAWLVRHHSRQVWLEMGGGVNMR